MAAKQTRATKVKDPDMVAFGAVLRARRLEAGMTQERLADAAGVHWTYIGQIERGERNLTLKNVLRLASGLAMTPGDLLTQAFPGEGGSRGRRVSRPSSG